MQQKCFGKIASFHFHSDIAPRQIFSLENFIIQWHTASFWDITIQRSSHDDLTEKSVENFYVCLFWELLKKLVKSEHKEGYFNDLIEFVFCLIFSEATVLEKCLQNLQINLEAKRMDVSCYIFLLHSLCFKSNTVKKRLVSHFQNLIDVS
jgi:hypothetical protein